MNTNTCEICGDDFKARKGKKYCSDSCRQKAYRENKSKPSGETIDSPTNHLEIYFTFSMDEFEKFKEVCPDPDLKILEFGFIRKNYHREFEVGDFLNFWNELDDFREDMWNRSNSVAYKELEKFNELFAQGHIITD